MEPRTTTKKMKPTVITPDLTVSIASEGSMGATVEPMINHWMMCAMIRICMKISTPNRIFDIRLGAGPDLRGAPPSWGRETRFSELSRLISFSWYAVGSPLRIKGSGKLPIRILSCRRFEFDTFMDVQ